MAEDPRQRTSNETRFDRPEGPGRTDVEQLESDEAFDRDWVLAELAISIAQADAGLLVSQADVERMFLGD